MSGDRTDAAAAREARARALRAARAATLAARREVTTASPAPVTAYLVCACGAERYGLPLDAVAQVLPMRPCTPVPGAAPAVVGLVGLSGRIVGVIGLALALGRSEPAPGGGRTAAGGTGHLVQLRGAHAPALAVDRVIGIARRGGVAEDGLGNAAASGYAAADADDGSPDYVAVDLPRLLRALA